MRIGTAPASAHGVVRRQTSATARGVAHRFGKATRCSDVPLGDQTQEGFG